MNLDCLNTLDGLRTCELCQSLQKQRGSLCPYTSAEYPCTEIRDLDGLFEKINFRTKRLFDKAIGDEEVEADK